MYSLHLCFPYSDMDMFKYLVWKSVKNLTLLVLHSAKSQKLLSNYTIQLFSIWTYFSAQNHQIKIVLMFFILVSFWFTLPLLWLLLYNCWPTLPSVVYHHAKIYQDTSQTWRRYKLILHITLFLELWLLFRVCTFKTCSICGHAPISDATAGFLAWLLISYTCCDTNTKSFKNLLQTVPAVWPVCSTIDSPLNIQFSWSCRSMKEGPCSSDGGFGLRENLLPDSQEDVFRLRDKVRIHNHNTQQCVFHVMQHSAIENLAIKDNKGNMETLF